MKRRRGRPLPDLDERRVEALVVAMALAPGVYVRNRMFAFFANAGVQRARSRAATLRGIVPQLAKAQALTLTNDPVPHGDAPVFVLRYRIPALQMSRVVELSELELATLRILAARAGVPCLPPEPADRAVVEAALARLLEAGEGGGDLARAAKDAAVVPG